MRRRVWRGVIILAALVVCWPHGTQAATTQRIGSCYAAIPELGVEAPPLRRELTVLIDRTVVFDATVQSDLLARVGAFMSPGDRIAVAQFSSYGEGDYARFIFDGQLDLPISADRRYWISKFALQKFDRCILQQTTYMQALVPRAVTAALGGANADYAHTDIIGTVNQVAPEIAANPTASHYLIIVSDMLENSDVVNFYHRNNLRVLDPRLELDKVVRANLIANLRGTRVFAEGPAFSIRQGDVSDQKLGALKEFWSSYFAASRATLVDFGTPLLHGPIR